MASNQRERLLAAVAEVTSAAGYAAMSVEDVILAAGVSRRTFYEHFRNKEDVFLAAYDSATARLAECLANAAGGEQTPARQATAALRAFLEFVASEPAVGRMWVVEALAAGPEVLRRREATMSAFSALVADRARAQLGDDAPAPVLAETAVGGVLEVVYRRLLRGEAGELPSLLPDLTYSVLLPYLGPRKARQAA